MENNKFKWIELNLWKNGRHINNVLAYNLPSNYPIFHLLNNMADKILSLLEILTVTPPDEVNGWKTFLKEII